MLLKSDVTATKNEECVGRDAVGADVEIIKHKHLNVYDQKPSVENVQSAKRCVKTFFQFCYLRLCVLH
jgi:hypothetical protein